MKKYFSVTFEYSENVYCSNIAHAETAEAVNAHYSKYEWVSVEECEDYEVEAARRKGMPIVEIESTGSEKSEKSEESEAPEAPEAPEESEAPEGRFSAYVTNLGKYNEGELIGEWVSFPVSGEELEEVFTRIGIDGKYYEEYFIADYYGIWAGSMKEEYISIERLNDIAETLQEFDEDVLAAALEYWILDDVLEMNPDDLMIYSDVHDEYDLGYYWIEESGCYNLGNDILSRYFDYEAFGRDIAIEANGGFTSEGFIEYIG